MRRWLLTNWSLAILGAGLVFSSSFLTVVDDGPLSIAILERALPFTAGLLLVWANNLFHTHTDNLQRIRAVSKISAITAVLFLGVVRWILFLVALEATVPAEVDYIYLNAGAIGALTGSALGYQYCRLQEEQARLDALTAELEQTNAKLRGKVQRLDEFAGIVSHDLRNPINVALGFLDLARSDLESETYERIHRALVRADTITTEMLELARQGTTVTNPDPVNLQWVAEQAWGAVATDGVTLDVVDSAMLLADGSRLQQLFENLFRNAIEHGGPDLTTVRVGTLNGGGFFIADDGDGFSTETPEDLFAAGVSTTEQGTGYGLAIVNSICEAHNWESRRQPAGRVAHASRLPTRRHRTNLMGKPPVWVR